MEGMGREKAPGGQSDEVISRGDVEGSREGNVRGTVRGLIGEALPGHGVGYSSLTQWILERDKGPRKQR